MTLLRTYAINAAVFLGVHVLALLLSAQAVGMGHDIGHAPFGHAGF